MSIFEKRYVFQKSKYILFNNNHFCISMHQQSPKYPLNNKINFGNLPCDILIFFLRSSIFFGEATPFHFPRRHQFSYENTKSLSISLSYTEFSLNLYVRKKVLFSVMQYFNWGFLKNNYIYSVTPQSGIKMLLQNVIFCLLPDKVYKVYIFLKGNYHENHSLFSLPIYISKYYQIIQFFFMQCPEIPCILILMLLF